MSSSAGLLTPRGPFSGAAPLALRPLSAIAATAAGGVPEARIKRLLSDLLPSLMSLHAQGEICGDISLDTVGMDEGARAHLLPELVVARSRRNSLPLAPGFAPIELYADTAQWPRGPWTDVYGLCAVMHSLVTGLCPPPAPERRAEDPYEPLAQLGLSKYSQEFLRVIDEGLSMQPAERPQSLADLAGRLGMVVYADATPASPGAAGASQQASLPVGGAHLRQPAVKRGKPVWIGLLLALVIVGGTFGWFQSGRAPNALITSSELMPPNPPMVRPEAPAQPSAPQAEPQMARAEPPVAPPGLQLAQQTMPALVAEFKPPVAADAAPPSTEALIGAARSLDNSAFQAEPAAPAQPQEEPKPRPIATPVTVRLDIRPWGEVWINGVARGISPPVKELRLIPGKYQVVLRNADLPPYRGTLEIKAGKPAVISHVFE
ncbi:MAG: serine/threonine protein kinase [Achromobacter sp.]|nr:serine/threonine protein kinase [Achromobacter sp.]